MQGENEAIHLRVGREEILQLVLQKISDERMGDLHIAVIIEDLRIRITEALGNFQFVMPHIGLHTGGRELLAGLVDNLHAEADVISVLFIIEPCVLAVEHHPVHIADFRIMDGPDELIVLHAVLDGILRRAQKMIPVQVNRIAYGDAVDSLCHVVYLEYESAAYQDGVLSDECAGLFHLRLGRDPFRVHGRCTSKLSVFGITIGVIGEQLNAFAVLQGMIQLRQFGKVSIVEVDVRKQYAAKAGVCTKGVSSAEIMQHCLQSTAGVALMAEGVCVLDIPKEQVGQRNEFCQQRAVKHTAGLNGGGDASILCGTQQRQNSPPMQQRFTAGEGEATVCAVKGTVFHDLCEDGISRHHGCTCFQRAGRTCIRARHAAGADVTVNVVLRCKGMHTSRAGADASSTPHTKLG